VWTAAAAAVELSDGILAENGGGTLPGTEAACALCNQRD